MSRKKVSNIEKGEPQSIKNIIIIIIAGTLVVFGIFILWISSLRIPDLESVAERRVAQSTKIFDRTGEILLFDVHDNAQRTLVPLQDISRHIKNATIAIEDSEFYEHDGIKIKSIIRAILVNIGAAKFSQGGSTITQQVIKNALLTGDKAIARKIKEWVLAVKLEKVMNKEQILELYLNETPYGGRIYGVEEASGVFFSKSSTDLSLGESAYIAALPQAPTYYSPYGNNRDELDERKDLVLERMLELNFITQEEYENAKNEKVIFTTRPDVSLLAPHFTLWVKDELEKRYGASSVESGGLRVITTLDYKLQAKAEEIIKRSALENKEKFNAENASLTAIDPNTGEILVMVGSRDYFDQDIDGNFNVALLGRRQPGSSFKPFVYATAFEKGYTPETVVFDLRTQFSTSCAPSDTQKSSLPCYSPGNYDNIFRGPTTLRNALAQSINVPAVKVLYLAGLSDSLNTSKNMGLTTLGKIGQYGLTLVLGGGEVSLLEMTNAYGVFATNGTRYPYVSILKVENSEGETLEQHEPRGLRVLQEKTAKQINDILSDNEARSPAFGERSSLYFPGRDVAAKTGTTNDYVDAWIIGYTPQIVVGAWAGNNDNSPMEKKVAGFIVAPMWNEFMQKALTNYPNEKFQKPPQENLALLKPILRGAWSGGETFTIDKISGKLATEYTPEETKEVRVVKSVHSILNWVEPSAPRGVNPTNPAKDSQYSLWEYPVRIWAMQQGYIDEDANIVIPKEKDDVHLPQNAPRLQISGLQNNEILKNTQQVKLTISAEQKLLTRVEIYLNGGYLGTLNSPPFIYTFIPTDNTLITQSNILRIVGFDQSLNKGEITLHFQVQG